MIFLSKKTCIMNYELRITYHALRPPYSSLNRAEFQIPVAYLKKNDIFEAFIPE